MTIDIDKRIAQYVAIRDLIRAKEKAHKESLKDSKDTLAKLAGMIQEFMTKNNITGNLKSASGTCYLKTTYSATVADGEAFINFVKQGHWDLIERRANNTAVKDYVKEHGTTPAGVNLSAIETLGVLRPGKSKEDE